MQPHDAFRVVSSQNVAAASSAGASAQSTAFASQTRWVMVRAPGVYTATGGVRIVIGDSPVATATSTLVPLNWPMVFACNPGQQVATISNDTTVQSVSISELA